MLPVSGGREVFFDQPHDDAVRQKRRAWRSGMTRNTADSDSYGNKGVNDDLKCAVDEGNCRRGCSDLREGAERGQFGGRRQKH